MHRVPIKDLNQYAKAIEVLTRVGGTYHGIGQTERFLLVTDAQYQALVEARVVTPSGEDHRDGTNAEKNAPV